MSIPSETVPSKFAKSLLRLVVQRDYDIRHILDNAGIDFNPMDPNGAKYQEEISVLKYSKLYQQVLSLLQDESFGLQAEGGVTPGAFRMLCYCIIHCENLGKAVHRVCEFLQIFHEVPYHISLSVAEGQAYVGYSSTLSMHSPRPVDAGDAYGLSAWHRLFGWLIGQNVELNEVHFAGNSADKLLKYQRLFHCDVAFEQANNALLFDPRYLEFPLVQTEKTLKEFLRTAPYQLMVLPGSQDTGGLISQVRSLMGHDFSQGFPGFEKISQALNMSAPTLRRRLKKEGTNYQQLKDDSRRDAAIAYLSRPELSINAVAALMGFTDPSAFHRSFKKWTGSPPGEFRKQQASDADH